MVMMSIGTYIVNKISGTGSGHREKVSTVRAYVKLPW